MRQITILEDGDQLREMIERAGGNPGSLAVQHLRAVGLEISPNVDLAAHRCGLPQVCDGVELDDLINNLRHEVAAW